MVSAVACNKGAAAMVKTATPQPAQHWGALKSVASEV